MSKPMPMIELLIVIGLIYIGGCIGFVLHEYITTDGYTVKTIEGVNNNVERGKPYSD